MTSKIKQHIEQIQYGETPHGYKLTDAGILPSDWGCAKLSDISEQITQTAGTEKYETVSISAGIGFVNQAKKFGKELSGKQYAKYTVLHKGDFSYNKGNSKKYPQGCVYRLKDRETAAVPNVFESFRITTGCAEYYDQLFISGYLNHQLYRLINHGVRDDGLLNLTHKDFYSCLLPVPPLSEQEKIAKILSAQDKVIECYEKKIEQLKRMKKYYLQNMFPKHGETVPKIRFKGFTEPWEKRKLGDYVIIISGDAPSKFDNGDELYVKVDDLNYSPKYIADSQSKVATNKFIKKAPKGSVIFPKRGTAIMTNKVRILSENSYMDTNMMALSSEKIESEFLYNVITKEGLYRIADTSTIPQINNKHIEPYEVLLPEFGEQIIIGKLFKDVDSLITLQQRKLEEEKKKKKSLQQLLLTGIVRV